MSESSPRSARDRRSSRWLLVVGGALAGLLLLTAGARAVTSGGDDGGIHHTKSGGAPFVAALAPTTTTLSCQSPVETNHQSHCLATITDISPDAPTAPQGTVGFESSSTEGSFSAAQCNLTASGNFASCAVDYTPTGVDGGTHHITATYQPTSNHEESSKTVDLTVTQGAIADHETTTTLSCQSPVETSHQSHCLASITDISPDAPTTPQGTVGFESSSTHGSFSPVQCNLTAGSCSVNYTPTGVDGGTHHITATYQPTSNHEESTKTVDLTVTQGAVADHETTTTLNCQSPVETSHQSHCVATITDISLDAPTGPQGTVAFKSSSGQGAFSAAQCNLTASGIFASCSVNYTPTGVDGGTHHITATYQPTSNHEESTKTVDLTVTQGAVADHETTTTLNCQSPVETSHQSHCVATITDISLDAPTGPQGTVAFKSSSGQGAFSAAQCNLTASGIFASCSVNYTPTGVDGGTHHITATYQPTSNHEESTKTVDLTVTQGPVTGPGSTPPGQGGSTPTSQGSSQVQVAAPPNTIINKRPRKKTSGRKAKFKFSSDQPGSTFQCKLDKKPYKPCGSPFKTKTLKLGRHAFRVKAISAQGIADPTPALFKWQVKH